MAYFVCFCTGVSGVSGVSGDKGPTGDSGQYEQTNTRHFTVLIVKYVAVLAK
jgi:hypothetical protein